MKNVVKLQNYYFLWQLKQELLRFVNYYNNRRYQESLNKVTSADVYFGLHRKILTKRDQTKKNPRFEKKTKPQSQGSLT